MNTRASYHFAADDQNPATTLFIHFDGYPSGAAMYLREMLLQTGIIGAGAFQQANQHAAFFTKDVSGGLGTSYRYKLAGMELVVEQRESAGSNNWTPFFSGSLLDFINCNSPEPMLHTIGTRSDGGVHFTTLAQLEMYLTEAQGEAIRYEAGVFAVAGDTAAERVALLHAQVLAALRAELLAGRAESGNYAPVLQNTYTVIAEIWDNEQSYTATVSAVDSDEAIVLAQAQYRQQAEAAGYADADEEGKPDLLRIWAVLTGEPAVIYQRDAA